MKFEKFNLSPVEFSRKDIIKGVRIPTELTPELAEDIGIHVGDGSLFKKSCGPKSFEFLYSGNILEREYMEHIKNLKSKLYKVYNFREYIKGNELKFGFNSLAMSTFYHKVIGLPIGKKSDIDVPIMIKENHDHLIIGSFLRGLIDTDFGLMVYYKTERPYPSLRGTAKSKKLMISISELFFRLGIKNCISLDVKSYHNKTKKTYLINWMSINGHERMRLWVNKIGFNNRFKYEKKLWACGDLNSGVK